MDSELIERLKKFLTGRQESFLVIEDLGSGFISTRARIKSKSKKIIVSETTFAENLEEIKKPFFPVDKVILAMGSDKALTIESTVHLKRSEPEEPIGETELDTLVFRGLWEFLNRYRGTVSKKLGIHDLDLVLAGTGIREVSLGPYRVFNPLGFKGENLHLRYRGTFINRELKVLLEKMENWGREKIIVEGGGILSLSIPQSFDYFVFAQEKTTDVFANSEENQLHFKTLSWGSVRILKKIALLFGVDAGVALDILLFLNDKSPAKKIKAVIDKKVKEEIQNLIKLFPKSSRRGRGTIFYLGFSLPFGFVSKFLGHQIKLVNFKDLITEQGYGVIMNEEKGQPLNIGNTLAFVTHVYSPPQYLFLNELLARRARWLTAKP